MEILVRFAPGGDSSEDNWIIYQLRPADAASNEVPETVKLLQILEIEVVKGRVLDIVPT